MTEERFQFPWTFDRGNIVSKDGLLVVSAHSEVECTRGNEEYYGCRGTSVATVRFGTQETPYLLAAAPELLEALEELVAHCASCGGSGRANPISDETELGQPRGSAAIKCPECFRARAVIAKARGQS